MNKERAREELEQERESRKMLFEEWTKNCNEGYEALKQKDKTLIQALDIAIESLSNAEIDNKIIKTQHDRIQELKDNEWVDVKDGLPKKSGWYWVTKKFDESS